MRSGHYNHDNIQVGVFSSPLQYNAIILNVFSGGFHGVFVYPGDIPPDKRGYDLMLERHWGIAGGIGLT